MLPAVLAAPQQLPPSQDPWYSAPRGLERHAPGTVLRVRKAHSNITLLVNNTAGAYQLLYRSTDARYKPSYAVTTVFLPLAGAAQQQIAPALVSYQIPYNTPDVDQSPSYGLSTLHGEPIMASVREGLDRGWAVSVPDFEGSLAAFSAGIQAGHAVLDSVRAVLSFDKFNNSKKDKTKQRSARYVLWGFSGGALASNFAAELQASYAPELSFAGAALGGPPSNFTQVVYNVTGTPYAAVGAYVLLGVTAQFPEARAYLTRQLHEAGPYNRTTFLSAARTTAAEAVAMFMGQDIFAYFTNGDAILKAPELVRVVGNNWHMGYHGIPQMPLFVYKAIGDELTSIATTDDHMDRICRVGANVLYQRNTVGAHDSEYVSGSVRALAWLEQVLKGTQPEPTSGCKVENVQ
ncbi:lipase 5 [Parathielavia hyrcaniae]|uniref:Lipase 5 n=1 Tax=Parathielavia hyrcaniae TaxID=113614 RepID=A0AAN6Q0S8_9PEZI|nr:lipase 5 [Parathielavia hyrcaniae]